MTNAYSTCYVETKTLANGANTITLPSNAAGGGVLILFPSGNTATATFKGVSGDTGIVCGKLGWCVLNLDTTAASTFVITTSAQIAGVRFFWF